LAEYSKLSAQIEFLYSIVHPIGIKISFELTRRPPNGQKEEGFDYLDDADTDLGRIILSVMKGKANYKYKLVNQCNGLIIDSANWRALVRPCEALNPQPNESLVAKNIEDYNVYPMFDGTFVNLYCYGGTWCLSSANGFDIGAFNWMGPLTYQEAFDNVLSRYPNFTYEGLNADYCYSIVFKHYDFHPFMGDPEAAYLIKVTHPETGVTISDEEIPNLAIGIPYVIPINDVLKMGSNQTLYERMKTLANNSMKIYTTQEEGAPKVVYGFVLRAKNASDYYNSNLAIESILFKNIRQFIYGVKDIKAPNLDHNNRLDHLILRAYLNTHRKVEFITLFQQYHEKFNKYGIIVNKVVEKISRNMRTKKQKEDQPKTGQYSPIIDKLVKKFTPIINKQKLNPYDRNNKSIIENIIVDTKFINDYYWAIYGPN
jgi:hypothetical protein